MVKFQQKFLTPLHGANTYMAHPTGNTYTFQHGRWTNIENPLDIEFFRKSHRYIEWKPLEVVTEAVTGVITAIKEEVKPSEPKKYTDAELKVMNREMQIQILSGMGIGRRDIPNSESGRIALILRLQK